MYILGLNAYHGDSSACLIKNGKLIAAIEEERIRRIKHWAGLPTESIRFCLDKEGIKLKDVDYITIGRSARANLVKKIEFILMNRPTLRAVFERLKNRKKVGGIAEALAARFDEEEKEIAQKIKPVEHHLAHLGSTFFVSPFKEAAVVSVDAMGDFVSTMWGKGEGERMEIQGRVYYPHSLGFLYTAMTQYLGFWKYGDEYKVMGLSAFGEPVYLEAMRDMVRRDENGGFTLNLAYFTHRKEGVAMQWDGGEPIVGQLFSKKIEEALGPARKEGEPITKHHENVAASIQAFYEELLWHILHVVHRETRMKRLCLAGGVAQNSLANGKITENTPFEEIYIPPAAHDAGTAIGSAFYFYHQVLGKQRSFVMKSAFWGPEYGNKELEEVIAQRGLKARVLKNNELIKQVAIAIAKGKVVGWFQDKTEWGPRALGNRSILANPCKRDMKEVLNRKIKKREPFRPFAPSILEEYVDEYFSAPGGPASGGELKPVPFMEKVYMIRPEKQKRIPAVCHVDGSGRLQTVSKKTQPRYWQLIKEVSKHTKVPIVLNTSFNENEPIVNRPEEAINCFERTGMDVLALGNYFIKKTIKQKNK